MIGITSYGAYIPVYRLSRAEIARAWDKPAAQGEKAVANYDEDSLTMAVAATSDCLRGMEPKSIDGLYFASTTSPYKEKQAAAAISAALGLKREISTIDFSNSLRCGTSAVRAAMDTVNAGSAKNVLVCVADNRLGFPDGEEEMSLGDGAAAFVIGDTNIATIIEGSYTLSDEIIDIWRSDQDVFVRSWEERFVREEGYLRVIPEAVSATLKKYKLAPKDFSNFVCYAPDPRQVTNIARKLGFNPETQLQDPLYNTVGNTGSASSLILLVACLEEAQVGDRILLASYGNGCDVFILKVTEEIEKVRKYKRGVKGHLSTKLVLTSYQRYLRWRGLVEVKPPARPPLEQPSAAALWRDNRGGLALCGVKCKRCGFIQYPARRVCISCGTRDEMEPYRFADKVGKVFTFSHNNLAASIDPPTTIAAVDFPEGGRIMCDMTDRNPEEVRVGMPVEMTFRRIRSVGGIHDYWWKCQPVREHK